MTVKSNVRQFFAKCPKCNYENHRRCYSCRGCDADLTRYSFWVDNTRKKEAKATNAVAKPAPSKIEQTPNTQDITHEKIAVSALLPPSWGVALLFLNGRYHVMAVHEDRCGGRIWEYKNLREVFRAAFTWELTRRNARRDVPKAYSNSLKTYASLQDVLPENWEIGQTQFAGNKLYMAKMSEEDEDSSENWLCHGDLDLLIQNIWIREIEADRRLKENSKKSES